ncbi:MAG: hypothetical protein QM711_08370 [Micropruina sp.]|uniref:helix-turn-helix domain-containing protein n=1 Tax=Micropruina sp. TaxID=2737536 RepID=UPI0039E3D2E2
MQAGMLTLRDVAAIAGVTRQAVTNWRRRSATKVGPLPFPRAINRINGVEYFATTDVLAWLKTSGRGHNIEASEDAPAFAVPVGLHLDEVVTFLALRALSGQELGGCSVDELTEMAAGVDAEDDFLLSEVAAIGANPSLASYVDDLMESSLGLADALDRAYASRLARSPHARGLAESALELLDAVAATCRTHLGSDEVALDPRVDLGTARRLASSFAGVSPVGDDDAQLRDLRRHLVLDEVEFLDRGRPAVRVLSVVGEEAMQALVAVEGVALDLMPGDIGVVLGSSAILCDALRGDFEAVRSDTLEMGHLVLAARLPRGLWKGAHRQQLGLWVLVGGLEVDRVVLADLSSETIDLSDLASDLAAALTRAGGRSFRYGRPVERAVLRGRRPLVPPGIRADRLGDAAHADHRDRIAALTLVTSEPLTGYDMAVGTAPPAAVVTPRSLGELVEQRRLEFHRGNRIDPTQADSAGTVAVLSADPEVGDLWFDPLDAVRLYPHASRTEPNDVVFVERPRPRATVDSDGGAIVRSPSRILRLPAGAGLGPHALAAVINLLPDDAGDWRTWPVPVLEPANVDAVEAALTEADAYLGELRRRESAMKDLITNLIQGVAAGTVTLDTNLTKKAG